MCTLHVVLCYCSCVGCCCCFLLVSHYFVFFKQKTAYEMRISDWSSDVCSSDLQILALFPRADMGQIVEPTGTYRSYSSSEVCIAEPVSVSTIDRKSVV